MSRKKLSERGTTTITFCIPQELLERLRINSLLGKPWKINRSEVCREALEKELDRVNALYKEHHRQYAQLEEVFQKQNIDLEVLKIFIETRGGE
jgi:metal-responsive CopG/Arc/MetJ family transcriptional regulator